MPTASGRRPRWTQRVLFSPACVGVPEIPLVGRYQYTEAHPPLLPHSHEGVIEICLLERGRQIYAFGSGSLHCVLGGDVLVAQPGEIHGTGNLPEFPGCLYWIQVQVPGPNQKFLDLNADETKALFAQLAKLRRQFQSPPRLRSNFERALSDSGLGDPTLRRTAFKVNVIELLLACIEASTPSSERSLPIPIARAVRALEHVPSQRIPVSEMARSARLSESHFKALFRRTIGMPPADFLRLLRLEYAQLRIRDTRVSVTEIAMEAGFSSSQHFATAFRKQYGCTPREFRAWKPAPISPAEPLSGAGVGFHPHA